MGYAHIDNLYKDQRILLFRECWALEKVHGTSAHVSWNDNRVGFFSGGESYERFVGLFDQGALLEGFLRLGHQKVTVYGEAYGGRQQGMKDTYGPDLRFIVFDVQVGDTWLSVPDMDEVARGLGFEVVPFIQVIAEVPTLDHVRDMPSAVAALRGMGADKPREGIVLRPLIEMATSDGRRIIAKHKGAAFAERVHVPKVAPGKLEVISAAEAVAAEWVTEMRLSHVLDKCPGKSIEDTGKVIAAVVEDVMREAAGEIVDTKDVRRAIGQRAGKMFKARVTSMQT